MKAKKIEIQKKIYDVCKKYGIQNLQKTESCRVTGIIPMKMLEQETKHKEFIMQICKRTKNIEEIQDINTRKVNIIVG